MVRDKLFELLKKGSAIAYNKREGKVKVFTTCRSFGEVDEVAKLVCEIFGVDKSSIEVLPDGKWGMRLEFEFEFAEEQSEVEEERSEERKNPENPEKKPKRSPRISYEKDLNMLVIRKGNRRYIFDYDKVKTLFEELPREATVKRACDVAKAIGMDVGYHAMLALFEFFDRDVNFDAELVRNGRQRVLVKEDYSLRDEMRKKLAIEGDTIGRPWNV